MALLLAATTTLGAQSKSPLAPPTDVRVLVTGFGTARVSWKPAPKAAGYVVLRSIDQGPFMEVAKLRSDARYFLDRVGILTVPVRYRVYAFDPKGKSSYVEVVAMNPVTSGAKKP
jgi:hypothetical protein